MIIDNVGAHDHFIAGLSLTATGALRYVTSTGSPTFQDGWARDATGARSWR